MTGLKLLDAGIVFERIVAIAIIRPVNDHVPTLTVRPQSLVRQLTHILKAYITGTPGTTPDQRIWQEEVVLVGAEPQGLQEHFSEFAHAVTGAIVLLGLFNDTLRIDAHHLN